MHTAAPDYTVSFRVVSTPDFAMERHFIAMEKDFVKRQIVLLKPRWWMLFSIPSLNIFRVRDWEQYGRGLDQYAKQLDEHEQERAEGLTPFKVLVTNIGEADDTAVRIKLTVEHGSIDDKKAAPSRPARLDGDVTAADKPGFGLPRWGGFVRRGIRVGRHTVEAEFSRLEAQDCADLVRKVLYLKGKPGVKLSYEINSRGVKHLRGEVAMGRNQ